MRISYENLLSTYPSKVEIFTLDEERRKVAVHEMAPVFLKNHLKAAFEKLFPGMIHLFMSQRMVKWRMRVKVVLALRYNSTYSSFVHSSCIKLHLLSLISMKDSKGKVWCAVASRSRIFLQLWHFLKKLIAKNNIFRNQITYAQSNHCVNFVLCFFLTVYSRTTHHHQQQLRPTFLVDIVNTVLYIYCAVNLPSQTLLWWRFL